MVALDHLLVDVPSVGLLDHRGVLEHHRAEVAGCRRGEDGSTVALLVEEGERAGVIDVGVAQAHGVDLAHRHRQVLVSLDAFVAATLVEAALEEDLGVGRVHQVHGPGDGLGGPEELDFQGYS